MGRCNCRPWVNVIDARQKIVVGRKNWMFYGSETHAENAGKRCAEPTRGRQLTRAGTPWLRRQAVFAGTVIAPAGTASSSLLGAARVARQWSGASSM